MQVADKTQELLAGVKKYYEKHDAEPEKSWHHNPILKARKNKNSRTFAINAMCAACVGCTDESLEDGFRKEIAYCTSKKCPLYNFRPYQQILKREEKKDEEDI